MTSSWRSNAGRDDGQGIATSSARGSRCMAASKRVGVVQQGTRPATRSQAPTGLAMPRRVIHEGRKIKVVLDTSTGPNGETLRRDMIRPPGAVVTLPVIDRDHVCLLRNYRFVIGETLWECPAGTLEPGEPIEDAAV